jgi:hypothetical protein
MKLPRDLYGRELAAALCRHWGYQQVNQVGSFADEWEPSGSE